jgi:hypothetical protein
MDPVCGTLVEPKAVDDILSIGGVDHQVAVRLVDPQVRC